MHPLRSHSVAAQGGINAALGNALGAEDDSACPVDGENPDYLGPAALAKLYRFYIDPREKDHDSRLFLADKEPGWWACQVHANCRLQQMGEKTP